MYDPLICFIYVPDSNVAKIKGFVALSRVLILRLRLELSHSRCVCNNEVEENVGQNTTKFNICGSVHHV